MARRIETIETLTDDLDGSKADRTVAFTVDGTSYEIELSKKNATAFEKALAPYVGAARKVTTRRTTFSTGKRGGARPTQSRTDLAEIRTWAKANGYEVSDRGRIAQSVQDAYDEAR